MCAIRCFRSCLYGLLAVDSCRRQVLQSTSVVVQQLRLKHHKQRFRQPSVPKEKEAYIRRKKVVKENTMSPKELQEFMKRVPQDDVWLREHYPVPRYRLTDALQMHRELAAPEMQDSMNALVYTELELDMSKKKKTQFMSVISGTVLYPHLYEDGIENRVVALTKDPEEETKCIEQGAVYAGGLKVIKKLERGDIRAIDYDHIVCHSELITSLAVIRKHLRNNYPQWKKGTLGDDVPAMVNLFVNGRTFESVKESEAVAHVTLAFGKLDMPDDHLRDNFQQLVDTISALKSKALSKLITGARVFCPPSSESFQLVAEELIPTAAEAESEDEDEDMDELDVTELESTAELDSEAEPLKASS